MRSPPAKSADVGANYARLPAAHVRLSPPALLAQLSRAPCSGSELAGRFGVTRAAIWKQIQRLRLLGVEIVAQAGGGYRMAEPFERLDETRIAALLPDSIGSRISSMDVHWQLDSTNSELLRTAGTDARDLLTCLAEIQRAGRGRRGRNWCMPLGGGIALSLLKRFDTGMVALAGLSLVAGIAAVQALADCGVVGIGLKWPNDLVAGERKLGGILVEVGGDALGPCHAVIGIGLNMRLGVRGAAAIDQPWIDLAELTDTVPSRNRLAARLLERLVAALDDFEEHGFAAFADEYARLDVLAGRRVHAVCGEHVETGRACGVDARGALRIDCAAGERLIDSGEVSIRAAT